MLASKCLKGKPATVAKAGEACMLLIELEQQAAVIEAVLKAFGDKVPKVVLAAVDIVLQAVRWARAQRRMVPSPTGAGANAAWLWCAACGRARHAQLPACAAGARLVVTRPAWHQPPGHTSWPLQTWRTRWLLRPVCSSFGAKAVDPKPIMKALPSLFGHTQAGVRDKAKETSVELAAYLGQVCRGVTKQAAAQGQWALGVASAWAVSRTRRQDARQAQLSSDLECGLLQGRTAMLPGH